MPNIASELAADAAAIESLLDRTFGDDRVQRTVYRLREGALPVPGLSHVVRDRGAVVATLRFFPVRIDGTTPAILLGPLAVEPALQGQGLGRALIRHGLDEARRLDKGICLVVGDPNYYRPFGFVAATPLGLTLPGPVEPERFQAKEMLPGWLALARGPVLREDGLPRPAAPKPFARLVAWPKRQMRRR
jgi:predicted N-acetyltransferase YhbS